MYIYKCKYIWLLHRRALYIHIINRPSPLRPKRIFPNEPLSVRSGWQAALDMTLTGKNIRPDKAKKMGLADIVCDPAALEAVALDTAKQLAAGTLKVRGSSYH